MSNVPNDFSMDDFDNEFGDEFPEERYTVEPSTIHEALAAIQVANEHDALLPANVVYCLSDLSGADLKTFQEAWPSIPEPQRRWAMRILTELSEGNFMLSFESVAAVGLAVSDPQVRAHAVELTWYDDSEACFHKLMKLAEDGNPLVRAASMSALGRFILAGEFEEFDETLTVKAQELAIRYYYDYSQDVDVRRRSLEAISHSSHPRVSDMIREAYYGDDPEMQASAVFAMGSSYDKQWSDIVLSELDSEDDELRFEAIRAAGNLELEAAIDTLARQVFNPDSEIGMMAVVALGEIGTKKSRRALEHAIGHLQEMLDNVDSEADTTDLEELMFVAEEALALNMLIQGSSLPLFDMTDNDFFMFDDDDFGEDDDDWDYYGENNAYLN
jgi:hypothetical protein